MSVEKIRVMAARGGRNAQTFAEVCLEVDRLKAALKPFVDCVHYDDGSFIVESNAKRDDYIAAWFAVNFGSRFERN